MTVEWEVPEGMFRCESCGKFVSDDKVWGDHETQGCEHRKTEHECEMGAEHCGVDVCMCALAPYCSPECADRFHGFSTRKEGVDAQIRKDR